MRIVTQKMLSAQGLAFESTNLSLVHNKRRQMTVTRILPLSDRAWHCPQLEDCRCRTLRGMCHPQSVAAQPRFYHSEALDHFVARRTIGKYLVQTGHDLFGGEVFLHQFWHDLLAGD